MEIKVDMKISIDQTEQDGTENRTELRTEQSAPQGSYILVDESGDAAHSIFKTPTSKGMMKGNGMVD